LLSRIRSSAAVASHPSQEPDASAKLLQAFCSHG
jgi:hypothetical protein